MIRIKLLLIVFNHHLAPIIRLFLHRQPKEQVTGQMFRSLYRLRPNVPYRPVSSDFSRLLSQQFKVRCISPSPQPQTSLRIALIRHHSSRINKNKTNDHKTPSEIDKAKLDPELNGVKDRNVKDPKTPNIQAIQPTPQLPPPSSQIASLPPSQSIRATILQKLRHHLRPSHPRRFTIDDISAFVSWLMISNILLIILGTTTFLSLVIYLMNTVFAQELVARTLGNIITRNSGIRVVFESAIVPDWRDGKISFNRCFVSKRPKKRYGSDGFTKGNLSEAIAAREEEDEKSKIEEVVDDGNYTQFDLTMDQVNVSFSLGKFINGKGVVGEVEIIGMRGVFDRSFVRWDPNDDARNYRNFYKPGDFEIDNFKMSDVLFKLIQPNGFRPFNVSIYNCELPRLRKNWLFLDFLNANSVSGSYDDSLFTIHKRHVTNPIGVSPQWKKVTRCRVDSLNVDHLNTGLEGPFGWITSGEVDIIGDITIPPQDDDTINVGEIIQSIQDNISGPNSPNNSVSSSQNNRISSDGVNIGSKQFTLDLQIRLNNVKAAVPIFTNDLSYVNNALVRPIVGFINSRKTYIPIRCTITKDLIDFDGCWTMYDSLLMDDVSLKVYDAFAQYVANEERRVERLKRVGFWGLQVVFQVLLWSLGMIA